MSSHVTTLTSSVHRYQRPADNPSPPSFHQRNALPMKISSPGKQQNNVLVTNRFSPNSYDGCKIKLQTSYVRTWIWTNKRANRKTAALNINVVDQLKTQKCSQTYEGTDQNIILGNIDQTINKNRIFCSPNLQREWSANIEDMSDNSKNLSLTKAIIHETLK